MRVSNPYRPGFNQSPAVLAGRGEITDAITEAFQVAALDGRTPRPILLAGSRGVGKTVLLERARQIAAEQHAWISVSVEVHPGRPFTPVLLARLAEAAQLYDQAPPNRGDWRATKATIKASLAGIGGQAEFTRAAAATTPREEELETALKSVMEAALPLDAGLLLTVDETHLATKDELASLAALLQDAVTKQWPFVVVLAGLPSMQDPRRMVTYLERGEWHNVGLLASADTHEALTGPAAAAGRPMDQDAADYLTTASGGYPYAIQVLGHHAWRASSSADQISLTHARDGDQAAQRDLAAGLYSARWKDSSEREQEYLAALARLVIAGGHPIGADVARTLGQQPSAVTYLRARLLQKGTIYTEGRALRFAVPGMAAWIDSQPLD